MHSKKANGNNVPAGSKILFLVKPLEARLDNLKPVVAHIDIRIPAGDGDTAFIRFGSRPHHQILSEST